MLIKASSSVQHNDIMHCKLSLIEIFKFFLINNNSNNL